MQEIRSNNGLSNKTLLVKVLIYWNVDILCYDRNYERQSNKYACRLENNDFPSHPLYYKRIKSLGAISKQFERSEKRLKACKKFRMFLNHSIIILSLINNYLINTIVVYLISIIIIFMNSLPWDYMIKYNL